MVRVHEAVGSNPATRTTLGALKPLGFKAPFLYSAIVFLFVFPFHFRNVLDVSIHPVCAGLLNLYRHVAVGIQGKGYIVMAQVVLDSLDIVSSLQGRHRIAVPLRYNNDKPEKPRNFKGLEVYQADFSSFSNPKNQAAKPLYRRGC